MLLPFFEWCEGTMIGAGIRDSVWLFPVIESLHLLAFAMIGGVVLLVDFRLFGLGLTREPVAEVGRAVQPWLLASLSVMVVTGVLLFLSEAVKCYSSNPFWVKIAALFLAILFTFTVRRKVVTADEARVGPFWSKLVALISLVLWGTVAWAGRWIGFSA